MGCDWHSDFDGSFAPMEIKKPIQVNADLDHDESQALFMTEALIRNYVVYLMDVADTINMEVSIATIPFFCSEHDEMADDYRYLDVIAPRLHIKITDEDDLLGEFYLEQYSLTTYKEFCQWIDFEIYYYMMSKLRYYQLDAKMNEKTKLRQRFFQNKI